MQVHTLLMRIHAVVVVYGQLAVFCHIHRKDLIQTIHGDTQLYAISVHEVVGWNIQIVVGLVIYAVLEESLCFAASLLVGVVACSLLGDVPFGIVFKYPVSLFVLLALSYAPVVSVGRERFVCLNGNLVFPESDHLSRQGAVVNSYPTVDVRTLHIFYGKIDGVSVDTLYLTVVVGCSCYYVCDADRSIAILGGGILFKDSLRVYLGVFSSNTVLDIVDCAGR